MRSSELVEEKDAVLRLQIDCDIGDGEALLGAGAARAAVKVRSDWKRRFFQTFLSLIIPFARYEQTKKEPVDVMLQSNLQTPPSEPDHQRHQLQKADHYCEPIL